MRKENKRVVIVGGGFGGVKAALELSNTPRIEVVLISQNTHFEYHGALYRSAVGHSPKEVVIPLREIFAGKKNVEVVLDSIGFVDAKKKRLVSLEGTVYGYDFVIFAMGSVVNYFDIQGLKEHTETMSTIADTIKLRKRLVDLFSQPQTRPARIAVVGGGASGVELAAELPAFVELIAKRHHQKKPKLKVIVVEAADRLLPGLSPKTSEKILKRLVSLGVEVHLGLQVESCQKGNLCLSAGSLGADILIWTAGFKPVPFYQAHPEIFTLAQNGKVMVNEYLQVASQEDIFVIGDNAATPYSGMAQTALHNAAFVARTIKNTLNKKPIKPYKPVKPLYVITVGGTWAVVQKGKKVYAGLRGWRVRRQADLWIFKNFQPYEQAIKTWRAGNKLSRF